MTSSPGKIAYSAAPRPVSGEVDFAPRRSLLGQALYDTFGQTGAKVGLIWIALLAVLAVFAPFIANSHPILYRLQGGPLQSPMLRHLVAIDAILVILFFHVAAVLFRRVGAGLSIALIIWPIAVIGFVLAVVRMAPSLLTFSIYRPANLENTSAFIAMLLWIFAGIVHLLAAAAVLLGVWALFKATPQVFRSAVLVRHRLGLFISAVIAIVLSLLAAYTVQPPEPVVYERYRQQQQAGQVDLILRTIVPYSPNDRLRDRPDQTLTRPSADHWFGTTQYSEDLFSRMLHACRVALAIGLIATSIATAIGIVVGGLLGYYAGLLDLIGMRLVEIIESIPTLILLLIVTVSWGRSLYLMMVVIGLLSWTADARFIRAEFFRLRNLDFVHAATAAGLRRSSIIFRHMLPNGVAPVLVNASFGIAGAILLESTLSFLGLGLGADDPSWGQLLGQAFSGAGFSWWVGTFPGMAIFLTVFSYILIGESMRDAIDPTLKKSQG